MSAGCIPDAKTEVSAPCAGRRRLSVYAGQVQIGTLIDTADGWLSVDSSGVDHGCYRDHLDAMRALP